MTFKGGVHPDYDKLTEAKPIEPAPIPEKIILPLSQHIGAPCEPIVATGDSVKVGQKVADSSAFVSVPIHSSVSGTVKSIEQLPHPITGKKALSIVIESDGKDEKVDMKGREYENLSVDELKDIIREAGIVGLGGAAFPAHVKLSPPKDKHIDYLIINGAECEPFLTTDHRLMLERSDDLIAGIRIIRKILAVKNTIIGIEENKQDAINLLTQKCSGQNIAVMPLKVKYPQGAEKTLIYSTTKRKVPAGGLPMDIGCVVQNIGTCVAIYDAVAKQKPLYERVVTITGKVKEPKNLVVRNGTLVSDLIEAAGGYAGEPRKLIMGGPMMGFALPGDDLPVIKGTSGITVFDSGDIDESRSTIECIRCGKCVEVCPMKLHPILIAKYSEKERIDLAESVYAMDCFECGCCSFICPSHIPLVHWIRYGKSALMKKRAAEKAKEKGKGSETKSPGTKKPDKNQEAKNPGKKIKKTEAKNSEANNLDTKGSEVKGPDPVTIEPEAKKSDTKNSYTKNSETKTDIKSDPEGGENQIKEK